MEQVRYATLERFPGYFFGSDGSVWSTLRGNKRRLKTWKHPTGHLYIKLNDASGKHSPHKTHRLILEAFVGPCPHGMNCAHNNGIANDNRIENLRWSTHKDNQADRIKHGTTNRGERCGSAKLTAAQVVEIRERVASGEMQKTFVEKYGVSPATISQVIRRTKWKHI